MTGRNGHLCLEEDTQEQGSVVNISGWKKTGPTTARLCVHEWLCSTRASFLPA